MEDCFIYFYKNFLTDQYGLNIEYKGLKFTTLLSAVNKDFGVGGTLTKEKIIKLNNFLTFLLENENDL